MYPKVLRIIFTPKNTPPKLRNSKMSFKLKGNFFWTPCRSMRPNIGINLSYQTKCWSRIIFTLGLFVIVSWISFLIPMDVIPGRMALLVTLFLVLVNIFNNVTTNTPKAEGLTAIEAWMLACILFVFGALVE